MVFVLFVFFIHREFPFHSKMLGTLRIELGQLVCSNHAIGAEVSEVLCEVAPSGEYLAMIAAAKENRPNDAFCFDIVLVPLKPLFGFAISNDPGLHEWHTAFLSAFLENSFLLPYRQQ